jgi:hypothetical protein
LIAPNSKKESLETIFEPPSPPHVKAFFEFLKAHITLEIKGMSVGFRENRSGVTSLSELYGYDYPMIKKFVQDFEEKVLTRHYESETEKK